jgi:BON domain
MSNASEPNARATTGSQIAGILVGGVLGLAVGLALAQALGGTSGIAARLSRRGPAPAELEPGFDADDPEADGDAVAPWDDEADEQADALGERVLDVFANDPILGGRAIEIEAHPDAAVSLRGLVDTEREAAYATTVAGGVPGVARVMSRLRVEAAEQQDASALHAPPAER